MKVLAIDSSNLVMGVAVLDDNKVLGEFVTNLKKNHSVRLMPAIEQLLKDVDMTPTDLNRIVVAEGPGSYTGVRIGVSIAKSLAWSLDIDLVGVSSLEVLAQNGRYFNGYVVPFFDARRGRVYTGLYQSAGEDVVLVDDEMVGSMQDWTAHLKTLGESVLFLSNDIILHRETILDTLDNQAVLGPITSASPRPSELARLGKSKEPKNIHQFAPKYLQLAEAEAKWRATQSGSSNG